MHSLDYFPVSVNSLFLFSPKIHKTTHFAESKTLTQVEKILAERI